MVTGPLRPLTDESAGNRRRVVRSALRVPDNDHDAIGRDGTRVGRVIQNAYVTENVDAIAITWPTIASPAGSGSGHDVTRGARATYVHGR